VKYRQQDKPTAWGEPVGNAGLLCQQMEPQLADLPAQVPGVGFTEIFGLLGEQTDKEVGPAEVAVAQSLQPGPNFGFRSPPRRAGPCITCYMYPMV